MTIQEMMDRKRELGYTNEMIAEKSGVPLGTVQKIFAGFTKAPRRGTVEALEKILAVHKPFFYAAQPAGGSDAAICEEAAAYAAELGRGPYTLKDYYALPDYPRVELIDGWFYDMASPSVIHQTVLGQLYLQFSACAERHPGCRVLFAPMDVRLDNDDYTVVQPDLLVVCTFDGDKSRINGAPDLAAEIVSPSSRLHDRYLKLGKYRRAGVREYWIVDPMMRRVTVFDLEHDAEPEDYTFAEQVPVRISGGQCGIDLARVSKALEFYERTR